MNLRDLLFAADADPAAVLVHAGDDERTWDDVRARATAIGAAVADAGAEPGAPVAVMLPNGADVVAALFGVWRADAAYVPVNPRLTAPEVGRVLAAVRPAAVVTTAEHAGRFEDLPAVVLAPAAASVRRDAAPAPAPAPAHYDADVALVQFTSGTTGAPRPVLLRHSGVAELLDGVIRKLRSGSGSGRPSGGGARPPMPNLVPVSLSLWAGLYNVLFALRVGAPVVLMDRFETRTFAGLVRRFGIRSTVLPPAAMAMLSDDEGVGDLAPLRFVRSITAPLSPLQARRFRDRFGIAVLNSYGQTEIGGEIVGWNAADARAHGEAKLGSVGRPHDGVSLRVVDAAGGDVDPGGPGELWVRTPALSAGYADGSDLADRLSPDGWFRTGDHGRVDADGFVWIEGRVSDMINRGGLKVFPDEVEEVLRLATDVADAAVVGVPDERLGEVPWAFVEARDGRDGTAREGRDGTARDGVASDGVDRDGTAPDPDDLAVLCRRHLAAYKVPVRFVTVDALPRNEVGKVLRRVLLEQAGVAS